MIRWTDKEYSKPVYILGRLQYKAYDRKYRNHNNLRFKIWNFIEGALFKLKMHFWHKGMKK